MSDARITVSDARIAVSDARIASAWAVLSTVPDPEVPSVSVRDLGIVRDVSVHDGTLCVTLTPTYSGCPATELIEADVLSALERAGLGPATARMQRAPAWTTDWISAEGREKMRAAGIAPPDGVPGGATGGAPGGATGVERVLRFKPRALACPRCASRNTERLSAFGSTACKSLHRCLDCLEPFEHFKPY